MTETPVLIAGAGPTGLALALWLSRAGVPFRLIDKAPAPGTASRAMAVQARTLEFYRQLGLADAAVAAGYRMNRLHLHAPAGEVGTVPLGEIGKGISPYPFALSLPQDDHERLLTAKLQEAGRRVERDTELVGLAQDDRGIRATLRTPRGEEVWAGEYLCGCDGAHSAVRHALGIGFPGGTYDQRFFVADAAADGPWSADDLRVHFAERALLLTFPVREPGMFRYIGLVPDDLADREQLTFEDVRAYAEQVSGMRVARVNWFSAYRVHHRVAAAFRQGRAFLAGDAGHVHSPAGGQGMNTGIGDAVNLAWKLAAVLKGQAAHGLLDCYGAERVPFARSLVATTDRAFGAIVGRGVLARLVRTVFMPYVLPLLLRLPATRRAQFRLVSQTRIAYRDSPLSHGAAGRVRAGDRLPWVEGADNFAPLASLGWQIHLYGTATATLRAFATGMGLPVHEWPWGAEMGRAGLKRNALYLVRPDGYVGYARPSQDLDGLRVYLTRLAIAPGRP